MERFLFLGLIVIAVGIHQDVSADKPMMMPRGDQLLIQEGSELKIQCYSKGVSVHFSFPEYSFTSPRSKHSISMADNGTSTFIRQNVVSLDTGWYACAAKDIEIRNDFKNLNHTHENIAWIYVYVNSSEPFADRYYTFPKSIIVLAGSPGIVPCRPTSPLLNVQLWQNSEIVPVNETIRFDPRIGFIIKNLVFRDLVIRFYCKVNDVLDRYDLYYSKARGQKPRMEINRAQLYLDDGERLSIACYGKSKIQFFFPSENLKTDSLSLKTSETEIIHENNGRSIFLRRSTVISDKGWYGCAEEGINLNIPFEYYIDYTRTEINWIYVYIGLNPQKVIADDKDSEIFLENEVQYDDGSDFILPCRPTLRRTIPTVKCDHENQDARFDPRYGFVMRQALNDSYMCCRCSYGSMNRSELICTRKISKQEKETFAEPGSFMLLTGEDLRISRAQYSIGTKLNRQYIDVPGPSKKSRFEKTELMFGSRGKLFGGISYTFYIWTVKNVTENDSGKHYLASESLRASSALPYFEMIELLVIGRKGWEYEKLNLQKDSYTFMRRQNESLWLLVDLKLFSSQMIQWVGPSGEFIKQAEHYDLRTPRFCLTYGLRSMLVLNNLTLGDSGVYRIKMSSAIGIITVNFTLDVQVPPTTSITNGSQPYYAVPGKYFSVRCCAVGSPQASITWTFLKQPEYPSDNRSTLEYPTEYKYVTNGTTIACSYLKMSSDTSGNLTCTACNFIDCTAATRRIFHSDSIGRFGIIGPSEPSFIGDNITLKCAGSIYAMKELRWDTNFDACHENVNHKPFEIYKNLTQFTIQNVLYIKNVTECHRRSYSCLGLTTEGKIENSLYNLRLRVPKKPQFTSTSLDKTKIILDPKLDHKKNRILTCCANGDPAPNVTWFKNDLQLKESPEHHFSPETCQLTVVVDLSDGKSRTYKCKAENRFGQIEDHVEFLITGNEETDKKMQFIAIALVLVLMGVVVAWFVLQKRRKNRAKQEFKRAILERFDEGAMNYLQLNMYMASQAEILPFDKKWEYPRNLLKFDKILGTGAFGVVRKAEAKSIYPGKSATTVAVKMVRATHRLHYMTALIRELKVLVHLGSHLNIVNLLGACTKNISYGELLVIVEFCRFGNLRDYLHHRKANFIDQLDSTTEKDIGTDFETDPSVIGHDRKHITNCDDDSDTGKSDHSMDAMEQNENADDEALIEGTAQPSLRCEYRSDDPNLIVESICTKDLLCWAWQVTRGMRYLAHRKVVHGDLAARNVLLADNNVIKICDFGLAEILYKDEDYVKLAQDLLPLQWMAVESLKDRIFSTQSDIWSFGIFLWELFTLGEIPYRGMNPRNLYRTLSSGYRLNRPEYAPEKIYRIMMKCWDLNPERRPAFAGIKDDIERELDKGIRSYYEDMSPVYTTLTNEISESGEIDHPTMDPSQIKTISSFVESEQLNLGFSPAAECRDLASPVTSLNDFITVPGLAETRAQR